MIKELYFLLLKYEYFYQEMKQYEPKCVYGYTNGIKHAVPDFPTKESCKDYMDLLKSVIEEQKYIMRLIREEQIIELIEKENNL